MTVPSPSVLSETRRGLHGVAELVLAGPQYRRTGTIRLRPGRHGFGTITEPELRVEGGRLVAGERRLDLDGATPAGLGAAAGVEAGAPADLYHGGSGVRLDDVLRIDESAAAYLADCFAAGDAALRALAPAETPVLWPEHFDLSITVDEVNFGVSPGDEWLDEPYAYVGPRRLRPGPFWNAPFGAARPLRELAGPDVLTTFLREGRDLAARS
jgi:hypothetical protein